MATAMVEGASAAVPMDARVKPGHDGASIVRVVVRVVLAVGGAELLADVAAELPQELAELRVLATVSSPSARFFPTSGGSVRGRQQVTSFCSGLGG